MSGLPSGYFQPRRLPALIILAVLCSAALYAENLVPNPGFEDFYELPSEQADFNKVRLWTNLNGRNNFPAGTPDYMHIDGMGDAQLPGSYHGTTNPFDGKGVAGLIIRGAGVGNFGEYISVQLTRPLTPGRRYRVSYCVTNGTGNYYSSRASNGLGVLLSTFRPEQTEHEILLHEPQFEIEELFFSPEWKEIVYYFTADSAYEYITLGCFHMDDYVKNKRVVDGRTDGAYFFLDNVKVIPELEVEWIVPKWKIRKEGDASNLASASDVPRNSYDAGEMKISSCLAVAVLPEKRRKGNSNRPNYLMV